MQILNSRHEKFDCSFLDMEFKMEIRKGYNSKFKFECKMCGTVTLISTENENETKYLPINKAIVNGSLAIGLLSYTYIIFKIYYIKHRWLNKY